MCGFLDILNLEALCQIFDAKIPELFFDSVVNMDMNEAEECSFGFGIHTSHLSGGWL